MSDWPQAAGFERAVKKHQPYRLRPCVNLPLMTPEYMYLLISCFDGVNITAQLHIPPQAFIVAQ